MSRPMGCENHEFKNVVKAKKVARISTGKMATNHGVYRKGFDKINWSKIKEN